MFIFSKLFSSQKQFCLILRIKAVKSMLVRCFQKKPRKFHHPHLPTKPKRHYLSHSGNDLLRNCFFHLHFLLFQESQGVPKAGTQPGKLLIPRTVPTLSQELVVPKAFSLWKQLHIFGGKGKIHIEWKIPQKFCQSGYSCKASLPIWVLHSFKIPSETLLCGKIAVDIKYLENILIRSSFIKHILRPRFWNYR